jgi:demethylmenaquinone methyltransferase / 2-methoxy-6-polyprenyl-1,4-benzoquinol methylase
METPQTEKRPLHKMFTSVPPSYDILNRVLTFGQDESWRKKAASLCVANNPQTILDLCCGTGDLTIHLKKKAAPGTEIKALDFSPPMLELAKKKATNHNMNEIEFIQGDAAAMPFPDNYFDSIGIAFAFRNLTYHNPDRDKFLAEILRVLKPGGRFVIVETSQPKNTVFRKLFHWQLRWITAPVGGLLSGQYGAYKYLAHSASNYHDSVELEELLTGAGFTSVSTQDLMGGITGLTLALKQSE